MKSKIFATLFACALSLTACGQANHKNSENNKTKNVMTTQTNNNQNVEAPVRALIEAMAAEDAERIRAQFSPTATQAYGADGTMKTPAETARWLESDIIERNGKVANPEYSVKGNKVIVRGQYSSRGYTSKADFLFTVENGLITSWRMRY